MYFFTATINSWQPLLSNDSYKQIIIHSLDWFHTNKRAAINGFVIMPNHFHLLWTALGRFKATENEDALLSFTGHQFGKTLKKCDPVLLEQYRSLQMDREYHFWERRPRSIEVKSRNIAFQKIIYMHDNPLQQHWKLVSKAEEYLFSSARYYLLNQKTHTFLQHYMDFI
ncbi:MAG TPA: hypothetical protein PLD84_08185 [Chitinophagales bacterium]|nr:hypothetical protein [Chitinophagales bacterium]